MQINVEYPKPDPESVTITLTAHEAARLRNGLRRRTANERSLVRQVSHSLCRTLFHRLEAMSLPDISLDGARYDAETGR